MIENQTKILKEKVSDYKRFAFILLALSVFLFVGLLVPTGEIASTQQIILISLTLSCITFATIFHKKAMKFQEELNK